MTNDKMREAFEARDDVAFDYERDERGEYVYGGERQSFRDFCAGWQAAAAQQAQEIEALRAQVQDQALHLISAHAQAEEAHADAQHLPTLRAQVQDLIRIGSGKVCHRYHGDCPTDGGPERDPRCPACRILCNAAELLQEAHHDRP